MILKEQEKNSHTAFYEKDVLYLTYLLNRIRIKNGCFVRLKAYYFISINFNFYIHKHKYILIEDTFSPAICFKTPG